MSSGLGRVLNKSECIDDFMIGYRNKVMAEKAWHRNKHRFCDRIFANEFKDGYIQGYIDIATGGNGCTPAIAPSNYWGWRYQSSQGQAAVSAWFQGFPYGVQAAEQDGVGHWQSVAPMGTAAATAMPVYTPINSGNDEVTNPFFSEPQYVPEYVPEYVPAPEPFPQDDPDYPETSPFEDDADMEEAGNVFNETFRDFPVEAEISNQEPELVSQREAARSKKAALAAKLSDQMEEAPESAAVVIDDIFGLSEPANTESDSNELLFSFE
jgi:hypothetical protein